MDALLPFELFVDVIIDPIAGVVGVLVALAPCSPWRVRLPVLNREQVLPVVPVASFVALRHGKRRDCGVIAIEEQRIENLQSERE